MRSDRINSGDFKVNPPIPRSSREMVFKGICELLQGKEFIGGRPYYFVNRRDGVTIGIGPNLRKQRQIGIEVDTNGGIKYDYETNIRDEYNHEIMISEGFPPDQTKIEGFGFWHISKCDSTNKWWKLKYIGKTNEVGRVAFDHDRGKPYMLTVSEPAVDIHQVEIPETNLVIKFKIDKNGIQVLEEQTHILKEDENTFTVHI